MHCLMATFSAIHPCREHAEPYRAYTFLEALPTLGEYVAIIRNALIYCWELDKAMYSLQRWEEKHVPKEIILEKCTILLPTKDITEKYLELISLEDRVVLKNPRNFDRNWVDHSCCGFCENRVYRSLTLRDNRKDTCLEASIGWEPVKSMERINIPKGELGGFTVDKVLQNKPE